MKYIILFLFPIIGFAQESFDKNNQLLIAFNKTNGYFNSNAKQDLSMENNTELIKQTINNKTNQPLLYSTLNAVEIIPYEYDYQKNVKENLALELIHNLFFSKPVRL